MKPKRLIPIFVTAACALGAVPAASAATDVQQATSANWSGYVVGSSSGSQNFSSVSGSWVQPTAKCGSSDAGSYSAFWIGLGGSGQSQTEALEQDGTEVDCAADGTASYFAWYELVPAAPVKVDLAIHPGDHISSKVSVSGQQVTMYLSDETTGQSFTKTLQMPNTPDTSSAEWIAEAPSHVWPERQRLHPAAADGLRHGAVLQRVRRPRPTATPARSRIRSGTPRRCH